MFDPARPLPATTLASLPTSLATGSTDAAGLRTGPPILDLPLRDPARYVRIRELARGGMGRIVLVLDRELGRTICVKEMIASDLGLERRFEREVAVTARLQHPAIINVLDAGRWPTGAPFYAMKHVDGRALDAVIADRPSLAARLALVPCVLAVADALAYAHGRGVIHRDLKPANVLIGTHGETVVIDWGLAKELRASEPTAITGAEPPPAAGAPALTLAGEAIGTPAYMPPGQARGEDVDERADVYAIGAMLYHVLAGAMPYADAGATPPHELIALVAERAPTPLDAVVANVPRDLLAIVAKAMARDPSERYPTAHELAEDLRRFTTGQLVAAHAYSPWQLVRRWLGRHRAVVAVTAMMLLILAIGGVASVSRIARARDRAEHAQQLAELHRRDLEELIDFMLDDLRKKLQPLGKLEILDLVARRAASYFATRPVDPTRPDAARRRATAHENLADVLAARGGHAAALVEYRAAHAIVRRLVDEHPDRQDWTRDLASTHAEIGDELIAIGDHRGALAEYEAGRQVAAHLVERAPHTADWQRTLAVLHERIGDVHDNEGDLAGALAEHRAAAAIRGRLFEREPSANVRHDLAVSHGRVADVLVERGEPAAALGEYRAMLALAHQLVDREPDDARWLQLLATAHGMVGNLLLASGDSAGALAAYRSDLAISQRLADGDPQDPSWQHQLAFANTQLGDALRSRDRRGALAAYRVAFAIRTRLVTSDPDNAPWRRQLLEVHVRIGDLLGAGSRRQASAEYRAAIELGTALVAADRDDVDATLALAHAHAALARALAADHEGAAAARHDEAALALLGPLAAAPVGSPMPAALASQVRAHLAALARGR